MRIALVSPNQTGHLPVSHLHLGSYLRAHTRHDVEIVDANHEDVIRRLQEEKWDLMAFTALTPDWMNCLRIANAVKGKAPMILGGTHIQCLPEVGSRTPFNGICCCDGEDWLLSYLKGETPNHGLADLQNYPALDWTLLNRAWFKPLFTDGMMQSRVTVPMMTARGCPYHCTFCANLNRTIRQHTPEWAVNEFASAVKAGADLVAVFDEIWTLSVPRLRRIAKLKHEAGLDGLELSCNSRVNCFSDEVCEVLKELNVVSVLFGFESGNQRVLARLKHDSATVEQNEEAIVRAKKHGLNAVGCVVIGERTETAREKLDTVRFIWRAGWKGARTVFYFHLTPYPGSEIWKELEADGKVDPWMDFDQLKIDSKKGIPWWLVICLTLARMPMLLRKLWGARNLLAFHSRPISRKV